MEETDPIASTIPSTTPVSDFCLNSGDMYFGGPFCCLVGWTYSATFFGRGLKNIKACKVQEGFNMFILIISLMIAIIQGQFNEIAPAIDP